MPIAALDAIWHWMPALDAKEDAEPLCRETLDGRRSALSEMHPDTLTSLSNLRGIVLIDIWSTAF